MHQKYHSTHPSSLHLSPEQKAAKIIPAHFSIPERMAHFSRAQRILISRSESPKLRARAFAILASCGARQCVLAPVRSARARNAVSPNGRRIGRRRFVLLASGRPPRAYVVSREIDCRRSFRERCRVNAASGGYEWCDVISKLFFLL